MATFTSDFTVGGVSALTARLRQQVVQALGGVKGIHLTPQNVDAIINVWYGRAGGNPTQGFSAAEHQMMTQHFAVYARPGAVIDPQAAVDINNHLRKIGVTKFTFTTDPAGADQMIFRVGATQPGGPPVGGPPVGGPEQLPPGTQPEIPGVTPPEPVQPTPINFLERARMLLPWLPEPLIQVFADAWAEAGDRELAMAQVRQDPRHAEFFPGIRRPDGSLRMTELAWMTHRDAFRREILQIGLNPDLFSEMHVRLMKGDVGIPEFRQRLAAKVEGILHNIPQVRTEFGRLFGIDAMDDRALLAAGLDPEIGLAILEHRITTAQVGAEAARFGFELSLPRAEALVFAGIRQPQASQFFTGAAESLPTLGRLAGRHERSPFTIEEFTEAGIFGDPTQRQRIRRLFAAESAMFGPQDFARTTEGGAVVGLRER